MAPQKGLSQELAGAEAPNPMNDNVVTDQNSYEDNLLNEYPPIILPHTNLTNLYFMPVSIVESNNSQNNVVNNNTNINMEIKGEDGRISPEYPSSTTSVYELNTDLNIKSNSSNSRDAFNLVVQDSSIPNSRYNLRNRKLGRVVNKNK